MTPLNFLFLLYHGGLDKALSKITDHK